MQHEARDLVETQCCIVGAGPAGAVLGFLLARAGVSVTVVESHSDFDRDFRGDTIHPAVMEIMDQGRPQKSRRCYSKREFWQSLEASRGNCQGSCPS